MVLRIYVYSFKIASSRKNGYFTIKCSTDKYVKALL